MFAIFSTPAFRRVLVVCASLLLLTQAQVLAQTPSPFFYYFQGQKIFLPLDPTRVAVRFAEQVAPAQQRALIDATGAFGAFDARAEIPIPPVTLLPLRAGSAPLDAIRNLNQHAEVVFASPVFVFPDGGRYIATDEFIVHYRDGVTAAQRDAFSRERGAVFVSKRTGNDKVDILRVANPKSATALDLANAYVESGLVEYAEPNFVIQMPLAPSQPAAPASPNAPALTPNDPEFVWQWHLYNSGQYAAQGAIVGADIRARPAWDIITGTRNITITIAIIDEGVDSTHPDLSPNIIPGYNAISNTMNTEPAPQDTHGTFAAGVAAARGNNGVGITGVCWICKIGPVKVAYESPPGSGTWYTTTAYLSAGIDKAWQYGADVLSNSWTLTAPSSDVQTAINNAVNYGRCDWTYVNPCSASHAGYGSTVVFAVGNEFSSTISYPAKYGSVIAVGASNWCDQPKAPTSNDCDANQSLWGTNYGAGLDVLAPGIDVLSTENYSIYPSYPYAFFNGTSASTPIVAGVVGLIYALNQNHAPLIPDDVRNILDVSADVLSTTGCDSYGLCKRVNAYHALQALYDLQIGTNDGRRGVSVGQTLTFTQYFTNTGYNDVNNGTLTVTVPAGYAYKSATPGFVNLGGGAYKRTISSLPFPASGTTTMTVNVLPGAEGTWQTFTAQIAGPYGELNTADNLATDTNFVLTRQLLPVLMFQSP